MLEYELRKLFILKDSDFYLVDEDLVECRLVLREQCTLLETSVNPSFVSATTESTRYHNLSGLISYLDTLDVDKSCAAFDLTAGSNLTLFNFRPNSGEHLRALTDCNKIIERICSKYESLKAGHITKVKRRPWRDSKMRDVASATFSLIFERFSCDTSHEILVKVSENPTQDENSPKLQLYISPCMESDEWQEVSCSCSLHRKSILMKDFVDDLCHEVKQFAGQHRELHISAKQHQLLGAWLLSPVGKPCVKPLEKRSLDEAITMGYFKPLTYSSYYNKRSIPRHTLGEKRALAVKLGYCLMDFFDSDLDSDSLHFLGAHGKIIDTEQLYLSFLSKLPSSPEFRIFKAGHPVLLAFVKMLIELDDGERLPIQISPHYGTENTQIWANFFEYAQGKESERNDSYLEALLGCLNVHTQLYGIDASTPEGDSLIRKELYHHVVQNLELALEECNKPIRSKRERSLSPPASDSRGWPNSACDQWTGLSKKKTVESFSKRDHKEATENVANTASRSRDSIDGLQTMQHKSQRQIPDHDQKAIDSLDSASGLLAQRYGFCCPADKPPQARGSFEVAIICALSLEYEAVSLLFDRFWDQHGDLYGKAKGDDNYYRTGRMSKVDVVLLLLPGVGKAAAASAAAGLRSSYPELKQVFLVGVCGGVPYRNVDDEKSDEILLGDVIISSALVQCDLGRRFPDSFQTKDDLESALPRARKHIRSILAPLRARSTCKQIESRALDFLEQIQADNEEYRYPGASSDRLFHAGYRHKHQRQEQCECCAKCHRSSDAVCESSRGLSCDELGCDDVLLVARKRLEHKRELQKTGRVREAQAPLVFLGWVGSGDTVLKSGEERDRLAKQYNILSLEMEGAGIWDDLPCIVVKGVCDYADSHKNKQWQNFAAATSACVVKALLERHIQTR
ncbi:hypothetical protein LLEC1_03745 [Akanthomyces lecanii]|uniref:DUF7580 domain-containing protein n=1 Tax=Cordyceps confragosa TaxID=2714763 RepID=A0A179IFC8_CORDF|nr:hypothetical protein LLEC1_03745 [Akanthomyces lecanii]